MLDKLFGADRPAASPSTGSSDSRQWWKESTGPSENRPLRVFNARGQVQELAPRMARGGEGSIFPLRQNSDLLIKIYHRRILSDFDRARRIREKLQAMAKLREFGQDPRFAWPSLPVFDACGSWIGYGMRRCPGKILHHLCSPASAQSAFPGWSRIDLLKLCLNLVDGLNALHRAGVMVGDCSTANFLVEGDASVRFIDCDAYHLEESNGRTHRCEVRTDLYTPPELLDHPPQSVDRKPVHELFSDAVLFYQILMLGAHPFAHRFGEDPVSNLRLGKCPLGRGAECRLPIGPWRNLWSHLTYNLKSLFVRAFREGHRDPSARPYLRDWKRALRQCIQVMSEPQSENSSELLPDRPKGESYSGRRAEILRSLSE